MTDEQFSALLDSAPSNQNIIKYLAVTRAKLKEYKRIAISYSGGSDSDIVLDMIELVKPKNCGEIRYVFFNTGLEWDATLKHVRETEERYGIVIEQRRAKVTIPTACRKYGVPFISKDFSEIINRLQLHEFDFSDTPDKATPEKYGRCKDSLDWYYNRRALTSNKKKRSTIAERKYLKEFMSENPPDFCISKKCCDYAKKDVLKKFNKEYDPDLEITGMRQAEGGLRVASISNCFSPASEKSNFAKYRPIWFWTDADKQIYKEWRNIVYSDCYELWGFKRTGCVGCPCASASVEQLQIAEQYEPNKVKAAYAVFGKSYEYRARYNEFKKSAKECGVPQMSLFDSVVCERSNP